MVVDDDVVVDDGVIVVVLVVKPFKTLCSANEGDAVSIICIRTPLINDCDDDGGDDDDDPILTSADCSGWMYKEEDG